MRHETAAEFDARHASEHPLPVDGCFACKLDSLQWSPQCGAATRRHGVPKREAPSWEKGIVTDERRDGSRMPVLDNDLKPIGVHDLPQKRAHVDAVLNRKRA